MDFIETLLPSLRVWQFFCLSPFALTKKTRWPKFVRNFNFYCLIYITIESAVLLHGFIFTRYYLDWSEELVIVYGNLVTMTLARVLAILVVIESWNKRSIQIDFLKKVSKIDSILSYRLNICLRYDSYRRETSWKSILWLIAFVAMQIYFVVTMSKNEADKSLLHFWLAYMAPFFICSLRYHQMITYVRLVRYRFESINNFIQSVCFVEERRIPNRDLIKMMQNIIKTIPTSSEYGDNKMFSYKKLVEVRAAYQLLYEASEEINMLFRWTLPINIANDFQKGLTNIFFFITYALKWDWSMSDFRGIAGPLIWAMFNIGHIMILSSACQHACEEAELTPALLHNVDFSLNDQQLADLVCSRRVVSITDLFMFIL